MSCVQTIKNTLVIHCNDLKTILKYPLELNFSITSETCFPGTKHFSSIKTTTNEWKILTFGRDCLCSFYHNILIFYRILICRGLKCFSLKKLLIKNVKFGRVRFFIVLKWISFFRLKWVRLRRMHNLRTFLMKYYSSQSGFVVNFLDWQKT